MACSNRNAENKRLAKKASAATRVRFRSPGVTVRAAVTSLMKFTAKRITPVTSTAMRLPQKSQRTRDRWTYSSNTRSSASCLVLAPSITKSVTARVSAAIAACAVRSVPSNSVASPGCRQPAKRRHSNKHNYQPDCNERSDPDSSIRKDSHSQIEVPRLEHVAKSESRVVLDYVLVEDSCRKLARAILTHRRNHTTVLVGVIGPPLRRPLLRRRQPVGRGRAGGVRVGGPDFPRLSALPP